mmetsp:Transcript_26040/g.60314  ORF Transcript_26040/g.60314 Transcript_26040/m.60314 type:complete len:180 (+) Transcript_26040:147-686(+)
MAHNLDETAAQGQEKFLTTAGSTLATRPLPGPAGELKAWSVEQVWQAAMGEPLIPLLPRETADIALGGDLVWAQAAAQVLEELSKRPGCSHMQHVRISAEAVDHLAAWMKNWLMTILQEAHELAKHREAQKCHVDRASRTSPADVQLAITMLLRRGFNGVQCRGLQRSVQTPVSALCEK